MIERFLKSLPADLPESPVILDIGSYTGEQAVEFATRFPPARIFAFEARPQSAETVRRTVATWPNIAVEEGAVHEFDGETVFQAVDEGNPGASSLFLGSGVQEVHPIQQTPIRFRHCASTPGPNRPASTASISSGWTCKERNSWRSRAWAT